MKFTKYRSHSTGKILRSSLRRRRFSAARSISGSSVEVVGETGVSCITAPFADPWSAIVSVRGFDV